MVPRKPRPPLQTIAPFPRLLIDDSQLRFQVSGFPLVPAGSPASLTVAPFPVKEARGEPLHKLVDFRLEAPVALRPPQAQRRSTGVIRHMVCCPRGQLFCGRSALIPAR